MARPWKDRILGVILVSASKKTIKCCFSRFHFYVLLYYIKPIFGFWNFQTSQHLHHSLFSPWIWTCDKVPVARSLLEALDHATGDLLRGKTVTEDCFPACTTGCSSTLWPPLSSLPDAAGRLAFLLHLAYGSLEPENKCRLAWGYILEVTDCLVPRLGNMGQREAERVSILKRDLIYLDLRGKVIHSLLLSKHLKNLKH